MSLFTRLEDQSLVLITSDEPIEVKLAYLNGEHVRIEIDAPRSVDVARKEGSHPGNLEKTPVELNLEQEPWWQYPEDMTA